MDNISSGSSKQRRDQLKVQTENLGLDLPFDYGKKSQLRTLKAACAFLRKEKHFLELNNQLASDSFATSNHEFFLNEGLLGFIVCFSKKGELIYLSENVIDYLGFKSMEILLSYDYVYEIAHDQDRQAYENMLATSSSRQPFTMYSLWFVSKIKRKSPPMSEYKLFKLTGSYDSITEMFIVKCTPILSIGNRDNLISSESKYFSSAHHLDMHFSELSRNGENLLGYKLNNLNKNVNDETTSLSFYDIVCPDYLPLIRERHIYVLNSKDIKGYLDTVKLIHSNGSYIDCLMNMYYDNRGFIICKFQAMSLNDVTKYNEYVSRLDLDWYLNSPSENNSQLSTNDNTYDLEDEYDENSNAYPASCLPSSSSSLNENSFSTRATTATTTTTRVESHDDLVKLADNKAVKRSHDDSVTTNSKKIKHEINEHYDMGELGQYEVSLPINTFYGQSTQLQQQQKIQLQQPTQSQQLQQPRTTRTLEEEMTINSIKNSLEQEVSHIQQCNCEPTKKEENLLSNTTMAMTTQQKQQQHGLDYDDNELDEESIRNFLQYCENLNDLNLTLNDMDHLNESTTQVQRSSSNQMTVASSQSSYSYGTHHCDVKSHLEMNNQFQLFQNNMLISNNYLAENHTDFKLIYNDDEIHMNNRDQVNSYSSSSIHNSNNHLGSSNNNNNNSNHWNHQMKLMEQNVF